MLILVIYFFIFVSSFNTIDIGGVGAVMEEVRKAIGQVRSSVKERYVKAFITYPTKNDGVFKIPFVHIKNDKDYIPWEEIARGKEIRSPKIQKVYPIELLVDFLLILKNVSKEMLLDECDDFVIYKAGFHLLRITNTLNEAGVVGFVEINHYREYLLRNFLKDQKNYLDFVGDLLSNATFWSILTVLITVVGWMISLCGPSLKKKKKKND